jgi:DNA-binding NtrC family response regulator
MDRTVRTEKEERSVGASRITVVELESGTVPANGIDSWLQRRHGLPGFDDLVGDCPAMREIFRLIPRLAAVDNPVFVVGETGTGKELVARAIHRHSPQASGPFVDINCAAIPTTLFESELFGHERGAFTDARDAKPGKFELADGGTLFLDEIGELPLDAQAKLLRVIERREVARLGARRPRLVHVRIVAATNADVEAQMARGRFRLDLYYRLTNSILHLPPLRDRGGDVALLVDHIFERIRRERRLDIKLSAAAYQSLMAHDWPGNVRELDNRIAHAVTSARGELVELTDLTGSVGSTATGPRSSFVTTPQSDLILESARVAAEYEARQIRIALAACMGNRTRTARALGINPRTLYTKMVKFGITRTGG